jgi:hypothetical protein
VAISLYPVDWLFAVFKVLTDEHQMPRCAQKIKEEPHPGGAEEHGSENCSFWRTRGLHPTT